MEVNRGYKLTEVGLIPADWKCVPLVDGLILQRGFDLPARLRNEGTVPIVSSSGIGTSHSEARVSAPGIVTGRYGTIGQVFFMEQDFWPLNTTLYVKDFKGNDPKYLSYLLHTIDFEAHSGKSGVPGVNRNDIHKFTIVLPPLPEQLEIARALSDADALLGAIDRLIAKKRDIKQAAMQQLLTGRTRLPGFRDEWEAKKFGDIATLHHDLLDPRRVGLQEFCVELEHIESGSGRLRGSSSTGKSSSMKSAFGAGDVLFGKLRAYLRKHWLATRAGVCSTEIWVLSPKENEATSEFLFQVVKTDQFIDVASTSHGTHMPRSDWNIVKNYELAKPSLDEQAAISSVLSDMDAEIEGLERRLAKTRDLKQGMIQELLTGRTRLV